MKYEGDVNYAADPYGYRPPETPKRKGFLGLGLAVAGIVAFAGTILFVYRGSDRMNPDGTPPLLTAETSPAKSRPDQPGGMEVPHQDKLVYERLHEKGTQPNIERLLPPPEAPLPRPVVTPAMPGPTPLPSAPAIAQMPPPPGSTATVPRDMVGQPPGPVASAAAPAAQTPPPAAAKPAPAKPAPASTPASSSSSAPAGAASPAAAQRQTVVPQAPKAPPAPASAPASAGTAVAPATAAPAAKPVSVSTASLPPPAPASQPAGQQPVASQAAAQPPKPSAPGGGAGNWRVQLASVRSESEAAAEWKRLAGKHADALGGVGMQIVKADLGEKGIFYRVQGGGIDESRAKSVCAQLRAQNVGCVVVRP